MIVLPSNSSCQPCACSLGVRLFIVWLVIVVGQAIKKNNAHEARITWSAGTEPLKSGSGQPYLLRQTKLAASSTLPVP